MPVCDLYLVSVILCDWSEAAADPELVELDSITTTERKRVGSFVIRFLFLFEFISRVFCLLVCIFFSSLFFFLRFISSLFCLVSSFVYCSPLVQCIKVWLSRCHVCSISCSFFVHFIIFFLIVSLSLFPVFGCSVSLFFLPLFLQFIIFFANYFNNLFPLLPPRSASSSSLLKNSRVCFSLLFSCIL